MITASLLDRLQDWYLSQCDGDWEHEYGIKIETLDNPGWQVKIDVARTPVDETAFEELRVERTSTDWYSCRVVNKRFEAACGPQNLAEVLTLFVDWSGVPPR